MRWAGHVARIGENRNAYRILMGEPEGKRPLGKPRRRWEDNIKMDVREIWWGRMDWIDLAQDRDQWRACRVPQNVGKFLNGCSTGGFSSRSQLHGVSWSDLLLWSKHLHLLDTLQNRYMQQWLPVVSCAVTVSMVESDTDTRKDSWQSRWQEATTKKREIWSSDWAERRGEAENCAGHWSVVSSVIWPELAGHRATAPSDELYYSAPWVDENL
jgi:hypothetical protein